MEYPKRYGCVRVFGSDSIQNVSTYACGQICRYPKYPRLAFEDWYNQMVEINHPHDITKLPLMHRHPRVWGGINCRHLTDLQRALDLGERPYTAVIPRSHHTGNRTLDDAARIEAQVMFMDNPGFTTAQLAADVESQLDNIPNMATAARAAAIIFALNELGLE